MAKLQKKDRNERNPAQPTYKEEIAFARAMGDKTWIKARHEKKYLMDREAAANYKGY